MFIAPSETELLMLIANSAVNKDSPIYNNALHSYKIVTSDDISKSPAAE